MYKLAQLLQEMWVLHVLNIRLFNFFSPEGKILTNGINLVVAMAIVFALAICCQ